MNRARIIIPEYYKRLEIDLQHNQYYYYDPETKETDRKIIPIPVKSIMTHDNFEFIIRKNGDRIFLSDQGKTLKMLNKRYWLYEHDVAKNLVIILNKFRIFKNGADFSVEIRNIDTENEDKAIDKAKYRLFQCLSFMNKMELFYKGIDSFRKSEKHEVSEKYEFKVSDKPSVDKDSQNIIKKDSFKLPIKYNREIDTEYEFELVEKDSKYFISDQCKTYEMLDEVFELKAPDVQKYLSAIMKECKVLQMEREFLVEVNSEESIEGAKYRLLECVSFMDTMSIFYV
jgi:hypothetical protein